MAGKLKTVLNFCQFFLTAINYTLYILGWECVSAVNFIKQLFLFDKSQSTLEKAQKGWILWKKKYFVMGHTSPFDFACVFSSHVKTDYVLQPNVSLYALTKNEAIFVETPKELNVYNSNVNPFFMMAQFLHATAVIKMPIKNFVLLADRIGHPSVPVIWISNTGRCGGTVLCQMFESVPGTLVIDQPDAPLNLYYMHKYYSKIDAPDYKVILRSTIRILCKPQAGVGMICIKPRQNCTAMIADIAKQFPDIKQIFIYRNPRGVVRSFLKAMASHPYAAVLHASTDVFWFSNIFPAFKNLLRYYFVIKEKDTQDVPWDTNTVCTLVYMWISYVLIIRNAMKKDGAILCVKYEDLVSEPMKVVEKLFKNLGIHSVHINNAISTLSRDSQRGSPVSRDQLVGAGNVDLSEEDKIQANIILSKYKFPLLEEDFII